MHTEFAHLLERSRRAEVHRERRVGALNQLIECGSHFVGVSSDARADFIAQSILKDVLKFRAKTQQSWIPLPVGVSQTAVVHLVTKVESQLKVVVAQCVNT